MRTHGWLWRGVGLVLGWALVVGCGSDDSVPSSVMEALDAPHEEASSEVPPAETAEETAGDETGDAGSTDAEEDAAAQESAEATPVPDESAVESPLESPLAPTPLFSTDFATNGGVWKEKVKTPNTIQFGVPAALATDHQVLELTVVGDASLTSASKVGPAFATQVSTLAKYGYGTYRARVWAAACASGEELVNGIFVYANDGKTDANHNDMIDNNEIDFEILCGEPHMLWMTLWTDYDKVNGFRKVSRVIDFFTGKAYQTEVGMEGTYEIGSKSVALIPATKKPGFSLTSGFLELGFEWRASMVRFFLVLDGVEVTLWTYTNATFIPQPPAPFMLNLWHTDGHWWKGGSADYPASTATLRADWFQYWE